MLPGREPKKEKKKENDDFITELIVHLLTDGNRDFNYILLIPPQPWSLQMKLLT